MGQLSMFDELAAIDSAEVKNQIVINDKIEKHYRSLRGSVLNRIATELGSKFGADYHSYIKSLHSQLSLYVPVVDWNDWPGRNAMRPKSYISELRYNDKGDPVFNASYSNTWSTPVLALSSLGDKFYLSIE